MNTIWDAETKAWSIVIDRNGDVRRMSVRHLIFATGFGGGYPNMPDIEDMASKFLASPTQRRHYLLL